MSKTSDYIKGVLSIISDLDVDLQNELVKIVEGEVCFQAGKNYNAGFKAGFEFGKGRDDS